MTQLEPTIQGFWSTPQRDMVLPSLEILTQLLAPVTPFAGAGAAPSWVTGTDQVTELGGMKSAELADVASGPYAAEKAALRGVLTRKDNVGSPPYLTAQPRSYPPTYWLSARDPGVIMEADGQRYTRPCTPLPAPTSQGPSSTSPSPSSAQPDPSSQELVCPADTMSGPDVSSSVKIAIRSSADRSTQDQIRWRLTPMGRDLFRPMVKTTPTPVMSGGARGYASGNGESGAMSPYVSPSGLGGLGHGVVGTPSWWNL